VPWSAFPIVPSYPHYPQILPPWTSRVASRVIQGSGFRVKGSGFRVKGPGFRVQGLGFRVKDSGLRVKGLGFRVKGSARVI